MHGRLGAWALYRPTPPGMGPKILLMFDLVSTQIAPVLISIQLEDGAVSKKSSRLRNQTDHDEQFRWYLHDSWRVAVSRRWNASVPSAV